MTDTTAPYAGHAPVSNLFNKVVDNVAPVAHHLENAGNSIWNRFSNDTKPETREWLTGGIVFLTSWLFMKDAKDTGFKSFAKLAFAGLLAVVAANYMGNHDAASTQQLADHYRPASFDAQTSTTGKFNANAAVQAAPPPPDADAGPQQYSGVPNDPDYQQFAAQFGPVTGAPALKQ